MGANLTDTSCHDYFAISSTALSGCSRRGADAATSQGGANAAVNRARQSTLYGQFCCTRLLEISLTSVKRSVIMRQRKPSLPTVQHSTSNCKRIPQQELCLMKAVFVAFFIKTSCQEMNFCNEEEK